MKGLFWNCILGVFLLVLVSAVSLHMGQLAEETGAIPGPGDLLQEIRSFFSDRGDGAFLRKGDRRDGEKALVVLDAGHGGVDPGKVGIDGQLEKEINLSIVKKLQFYLEQNDVEVILTRKGDGGLYAPSDRNKKSADMKKRVEIINKAAPDVMVSIHQNSYHQPEIFGAQVFYFQKSEEGKRFAQIVQARFDYCLGEENRRQAKANGSYYLLSHAKPVSIIVEAGFLSNKKEAAGLETEEYQDKVEWTVAMGILEYLGTETDPRQGTEAR